MENVLFDEQTINANVQYALSVISENVDKDGNLIVPEAASMDEATKLFANMVGNPQKSFADIAKSPKAAMAMNMAYRHQDPLLVFSSLIQTLMTYLQCLSVLAYF